MLIESLRINFWIFLNFQISFLFEFNIEFALTSGLLLWFQMLWFQIVKAFQQSCLDAKLPLSSCLLQPAKVDNSFLRCCYLSSGKNFTSSDLGHLLTITRENFKPNEMSFRSQLILLSCLYHYQYYPPISPIIFRHVT